MLQWEVIWNAVGASSGPYTQVHIPPIPDPEYAGKTKRGNWADVLTQMDDFTGRILDALDNMRIAHSTIVVWTSDNGGDPNFRMPAIDPDPEIRLTNTVVVFSLIEITL